MTDSTRNWAGVTQYVIEDGTITAADAYHVEDGTVERIDLPPANRVEGEPGEFVGVAENHPEYQINEDHDDRRVWAIYSTDDGSEWGVTELDFPEVDDD